jgi:hypothetical protein
VFSYAIAQNKDDPDTLQKNLLAIVPHAFGNRACLAAPLLKFDLLLNLHQQCTCDQHSFVPLQQQL